LITHILVFLVARVQAQYKAENRNGDKFLKGLTNWFKLCYFKLKVRNLKNTSAKLVIRRQNDEEKNSCFDVISSMLAHNSARNTEDNSG